MYDTYHPQFIAISLVNANYPKHKPTKLSLNVQPTFSAVPLLLLAIFAPAAVPLLLFIICCCCCTAPTPPPPGCAAPIPPPMPPLSTAANWSKPIIWDRENVGLGLNSATPSAAVSSATKALMLMLSVEGNWVGKVQNLISKDKVGKDKSDNRDRLAPCALSDRPVSSKCAAIPPLLMLPL